MHLQNSNMLKTLAFVTCLTVGCGTGSYDERLETRISELKASGGTTDEEKARADKERAATEIEEFVEISPEDQALIEANERALAEGRSLDEAAAAEGAGTEAAAGTEEFVEISPEDQALIDANERALAEGKSPDAADGDGASEGEPAADDGAADDPPAE